MGAQSRYFLISPDVQNPGRVCLWRVVRVSAVSALLPIVSICIGAPLLIYFFPELMQHLFFLNFRRMPMTDYDNVTSNGVKTAGRSFHLQGEAGRIGAWHMLPQSLADTPMSDDEMEALLGDQRYPVVLYAHGNSFDRTIAHRCELYNVLTAAGYQVVSFDYRGYGDSEGSPTEGGIVNDTRVVYDYVRMHTKENAIVVWGHSMGTGVCTRLTKELSLARNAPAGLVLESPFNNLRDAVMNHPFSIPIRWMTRGMIDRLVLNPLRSVGLVMESDERITHITCPILILHAEDDHIIPVKLGRALKEAAESSKRDVEYVEFPKTREFAHKFIYTAPELPEIVSKFVSRCRSAAASPSPSMTSSPAEPAPTATISS
ncbi:hypothetical protein PMAYCL1PPCAC_27309 [Pristionchus mayeri]|uniref:Serine aminopeptidase S33 domain-containing protein n=1 Tax=Pristionchus mayeri TaxID=1317129 RepID=A0AAN5D7L2_9BILA|nr:hypothetical protein PMAYCL1PPCAC_27309 [Pristionchus mayeri]